MKSYTIKTINQTIQGALTGDREVVITGVNQVSEATANQLTFIGEKKYIRLWQQSNASAAIVDSRFDLEADQGRALISVPDPDLALAKVLAIFSPEPPRCEAGIHSTAVIDETATIGVGAAIGAGCYIGPGVVVGENTKFYPNVTVLDDTNIGSGTVIWSGTVIRERCKIGKQCIIHPNVSIGADGFGYRPSPDGKGMVKIPQIGNVEIGDHVEIGAGSCIDRGKFSSTIVGDGTKIDNLVQIAHNCKIGRSCVMAGQSGLAGSVTLGDGVIMGGRAIVSDHVTIGAGAILGGNTGVISDVKPGKTLLGIPADDYRKTMRLWASLKHIPDFIQKIKKSHK
jgi:UDP-3-O-[3-hydroxymyristoyl] glucosamine N-acyltransferase